MTRGRGKNKKKETESAPPESAPEVTAETESAPPESAPEDEDDEKSEQVYSGICITCRGKVINNLCIKCSRKF